MIVDKLAKELIEKEYPYLINNKKPFPIYDKSELYQAI